jgi:hypothetical protein
MTIPRSSSRWTMTTPNPTKLPGGQAAALVVVVDNKQGQELSGQTLWTRIGPVRLQDKGRGIRRKDMTPHEQKTGPKSGGWNT